MDFVPASAKFLRKNDGYAFDSASGCDHLRFIDWLVKRETDFHKILRISKRVLFQIYLGASLFKKLRNRRLRFCLQALARRAYFFGMHTCEKIYTDIPIGHVQHRHPGHCSFVHGHNWSLTLTFACEELDPLGFVIDFGGIKFINQWISEHLDHACMFAESDTEGLKMLAAFPRLFKPYILENCSAEGLATHLFDVFDALVRKESAGRAWLKSIKVGEDSKNFAYFEK